MAVHTYTYSEKGYQIITYVRKYTCMLKLAFVLKCKCVLLISHNFRVGVQRKVPKSTRLQIFHTYVMNNTYIRKPKVYKTFFWNFCSNTNPEFGRSDKLYTVLYIHLIQWCTNKSSTLIILFVYLVCIPFPAIHRLSHYLLMKYIQIHIVDFRNVRRSVYRRDLPF